MSLCKLFALIHFLCKSWTACSRASTKWTITRAMPSLYKHLLSPPTAALSHPHPPSLWLPILLLKRGVGNSWRRKGTLLVWDRKASLSASCLLFVWLITGLLHESEPDKDQWGRCRVLRVTSWLLNPIFSEKGIVCFFLTHPPSTYQEVFFPTLRAHNIKIRQNVALKIVYRCLKRKKNGCVLISNDNFCVFILVTVTTSQHALMLQAPESV